MKAIEVTKEIKEITGYRADDGTFFRDEEECRKYESTANAVIRGRFVKLFVDKPFIECDIYKNFGFGSEEFDMGVILLKNEEDLKAANMYLNITSYKDIDEFTSNDIGKRILVGYNNSFGEDILYKYGTQEELVENFRNDIDKFYNPERYKEDEKEKEKE